ncbi:MAG TPA: acylneuraminate cytidylyltransferase [Pirellulales bacterium]|nr:acylneuraminate cytidylyltransferase [Pirellulales bacterium]
MSRILAIIPARSGSKGIPGKNLCRLAGRSLLEWSIAAARQSKHNLRIAVSTDGPAIADEAHRCGAEAVMRPEAISGDLASSEAALLHVLETLKAKEGYVPELIVFLQCTSPLTTADDIDGTIAALEREQADTALAVVPFHYFIWGRDAATGEAIGINHDKHIRLLRQQRSPEYLEAGAVYVMKAQGFLQAKHRFFGKTALYEMPAEHRTEIDEPADLDIAELRLQHRSQADRRTLLPNRLGAIILDFDGVFTDNRVVVFDDGREAVVCNRSDGWGLAGLKRDGWPMCVISTESNPVVAARCRKLGLDYLQGIDDKLAAVKRWLSERNVSLAETLFLGNDVNDLACLQAVGCPAVVADAHPVARAAARLVLTNNGGAGALRELAELITQRYGVTSRA